MKVMVDIDVNKENHRYCPRCGNMINTFMGDGTAICKLCEFGFVVLENKSDSMKEIVDALKNNGL